YAYRARSVFVRREPRFRVGRTSVDLFFLALVPLFIVIAAFAGLRIAADCAGLIAFASIGLALRGRSGARQFFPLHACLYAPLWIAERSFGAYFVLLDRLSAVPAARLKGMSVGVTTPRETKGSASTIA